VLRAAWRYAGRTTPDVANTTTTNQPGAQVHGSSGGRAAGTTVTGWRNRALATVGLAFAAAAVVLPQQVAHGGLSASDLAAIRIVMQASSPAAEPQVVISARSEMRMKPVSANGRYLMRDTARRGATQI
jgi:membrane glycosyltransferase